MPSVSKSFVPDQVRHFVVPNRVGSKYLFQQMTLTGKGFSRRFLLDAVYFIINSL